MLWASLENINVTFWFFMIFFSDPWKRIFLGHADRCGNITLRVVWPSYHGAAGRPARWTKMQAWNSRDQTPEQNIFPNWNIEDIIMCQ